MSNFALKPDLKYTYADYLNWDDGERWELIDGEVYNMSPAPRRIHQKISGRLFRKIGNHLDGKTCQAYTAPFDVRLPLSKDNSDIMIDTVVQPDIVVVCDEKKLDDYGCVGAPDIVIEIVSQNSVVRDKREKFILYEKVGVKEYWIVYPDLKIIETYRLENGFYGKPVVYCEDDKIEVKLLGDLIIEVNEIFI